MPHTPSTLNLPYCFLHETHISKCFFSVIFQSRQGIENSADGFLEFLNAKVLSWQS